MENIFSSVENFFGSEQVQAGLRALAVAAIGLLVWWTVRRRLRLSRLSPQLQFIVRRSVSVAILVVTITWALRELGLNLGVLLGSAGIFTIALGFAARTSVSNIISGIFLMGERPFGVGDLIQIGQTIGEVLSIDLLSVKVLTFDNLQVRVPNESMLKTNVTNLTRFAIRRVDVKVGVAYREDLSRVKELLSGIAERSPLCLQEPKPIFVFLGFGDSSVDLQFSVWAATKNFLDVRNMLFEEIKKTFEANDVEIPFPHRTLYTGSQTRPWPAHLAALEAAAPQQLPQASV